jgi:hypothetical protein
VQQKGWKAHDNEGEDVRHVWLVHWYFFNLCVHHVSDNGVRQQCVWALLLLQTVLCVNLPLDTLLLVVVYPTPPCSVIVAIVVLGKETKDISEEGLTNQVRGHVIGSAKELSSRISLQLKTLEGEDGRQRSCFLGVPHTNPASEPTPHVHRCGCEIQC